MALGGADSPRISIGVVAVRTDGGRDIGNSATWVLAFVSSRMGVRLTYTGWIADHGFSGFAVGTGRFEVK
jgi:hypothetical protein